jgi:hypothetical protein
MQSTRRQIDYVGAELSVPDGSSVRIYENRHGSAAFASDEAEEMQYLYSGRYSHGCAPSAMDWQYNIRRKRGRDTGRKEVRGEEARYLLMLGVTWCMMGMDLCILCSVSHPA